MPFVRIQKIELCRFHSGRAGLVLRGEKSKSTIKVIQIVIVRKCIRSIAARNTRPLIAVVGNEAMIHCSSRKGRVQIQRCSIVLAELRILCQSVYSKKNKNYISYFFHQQMNMSIQYLILKS